MKIVNKKQLCDMPKGTLFYKLDENRPDEYDCIRMKYGNYKWPDGTNHFNGSIHLIPTCINDDEFREFIPDKSISYKSELYNWDDSDAELSDRDLLVVFENNEIKEMINLLKSCLSDSEDFVSVPTGLINDIYFKHDGRCIEKLHQLIKQ